MEGNEKMTCPKCGREMIFRDKVNRRVKVEYGEVEFVSVDRFECKECGVVKRDLPNYILPYKHYRRDIVERFIAGEISQYDIFFEDYPCNTTIRDWIKSA